MPLVTSSPTSSAITAPVRSTGAGSPTSQNNSPFSDRRPQHVDHAQSDAAGKSTASANPRDENALRRAPQRKPRRGALLQHARLHRLSPTARRPPPGHRRASFVRVPPGDRTHQPRCPQNHRHLTTRHFPAVLESTRAALFVVTGLRRSRDRHAIARHGEKPCPTTPTTSAKPSTQKAAISPSAAAGSLSISAWAGSAATIATP